MEHTPLPPDNIRSNIDCRDDFLAQGMAAMKNSQEIHEHKMKVFDRDGWRCINPGCTRPATELARQGLHNHSTMNLWFSGT